MLNSQGLEVRKRQAEMSPKEAAEYAAKQKEESRRKQHDMFLISTYPSVKEIENVRDVRLDQINGADRRRRGIHREPHHARRWPEATRAASSRLTTPSPARAACPTISPRKWCAP